MDKKIERELVQNLQLMILQEFFKIQMEEEYGAGWTREVKSKVTLLSAANPRSTYGDIKRVIDTKTFENFNETSLDVTALKNLMLGSSNTERCFENECKVGSVNSFRTQVFNLVKDKNALVSHISNPNAINEVNALIHGSLAHIEEFLDYLDNANWNYNKKDKFIKKYRDKVAEINDSPTEKGLKSLPFNALKQMVSDNIAEAMLEMSLRINDGNIPIDEYDAIKADELLEKAVRQGCADAKARLAYKKLNAAKGNKKEIIEASNLLAEASAKGSGYAYFTYGYSAEKGLTAKPNILEAKENYEKAAELGCIEAKVKLAYLLAEENPIHLGKLVELAKSSKNLYAYSHLSDYYYEADLKKEYFTTLKNGAKLGFTDMQAEYGYSLLYDKDIDKNPQEAVKQLKMAASKGSADAKSYLGMYYSDSTFGEPDKALAFEYYNEAAEMGDSFALWQRAIYYYTGNCVEKDYQKSLDDALKAYDDYKKAGYVLGKLYENSEILENDAVKVFNYYNAAANEGHVASTYEVGLCYKEGKGTKKSQTLAVAFFTKAAEKGHARAHFELAENLRINKAYDSAIKYYTIAAQKGVIEAEYGIGLCYAELGEETKAMKHYKVAADNGNKYAANALGDYYGVKRPVFNNPLDINKAIEYYEMANNHYEIALIYLEGRGLSAPDYQKAVEEFQRAANDDFKACYALGHCYCFGFGVKQDYSEAVRQYARYLKENGSDSKEAKTVNFFLCYCLLKLGKYQGLIDGFKNTLPDEPFANYMLGYCYFYGIGTEIDFIEAEKYFKALDDYGTMRKYDNKFRMIIEKSTAFSNDIFTHNKYLLGECYYRYRLKRGEAKKYFEFAYKFGSIANAKLRLDCIELLQTPVNEQNFSNYKDFALKGDVWAKDSIITYLYNSHKYNEVEELCLNQNWFEKLSTLYLADVMEWTRRPKIQHSRTIEFLNKAKERGYKIADVKINLANEKLEQVTKMKKSFN